MKRIWIGIGLLILILGIGIPLEHHIQSNHLRCAGYLDHAADYAAAGNWRSSGDLVAQAKAIWEDNRRLNAAITDHEPMDEIDAAFSELEVYLSLQHPSAFCATCRPLSGKLENLGNAYRITWWNFL